MPGRVCQKPGGIFNNCVCAGSGPPERWPYPSDGGGGWLTLAPRGERGSPGVPPPPGPCPRPARAASRRDALGSRGPRGRARGEPCCGARALPRPAVADAGTLTLAWKRELSAGALPGAAGGSPAPGPLSEVFE